MPKAPVGKRIWYLGVDPGMHGSASLLNHEGQPLDLGHGISCLFAKYTPYEVAVWLSDIQSQADAEWNKPTIRSALERVWTIQKAGRSTAFKFGKAAGFIEGVLISCQIQFGWSLVMPTPVKWQTAMGCKTKGDKSVSRLTAQKRWPKFTKQITNDNADSLLIADWLRCYADNGVGQAAS